MNSTVKTLKHIIDVKWIRTIDFAKDMGYSAAHFRNMINGRRPVADKFKRSLKAGLKDKIQELQALVDVLDGK